MTTILTFRCNDPQEVLQPTECVMDEHRQWTLVYGSESCRVKLAAITTHFEIHGHFAQYDSVSALMLYWKKQGFAGEFDPPYLGDPDDGIERIH